MIERPVITNYAICTAIRKVFKDWPIYRGVSAYPGDSFEPEDHDFFLEWCSMDPVEKERFIVAYTAARLE